MRMTADRRDDSPGFLTPPTAQEKRSAAPVAIAAAAVIAAVLIVFFFFGSKEPPANPGGAGLAAPAAYASKLPISNIQMSDSTSLSGGTDTYVDGQISNTGGETITGVTVQVVFRDASSQIIQKQTMPLMLIRTREPYVDTEPVSAAPIKPGEQRPFRLIFEQVSQDWNQQYPEIRIIKVAAR